MRHAGKVLKEAREAKKISLKQISEKTKIKEKFLKALEEGDWEALPNFSIAHGFARSFAQALDLNTDFITALVRRDFPINSKNAKKPKELPVTPETVWTPRATIVTTLLISLTAIVIYLARQYIMFVAPPNLEVNTALLNTGILVTGKTRPTATLEINRKAVLVEKDGTFKVNIERSELGDKIEVKASSRTGKSTIKILPSP